MKFAIWGLIIIAVNSAILQTTDMFGGTATCGIVLGLLLIAIYGAQKWSH